MKLLLYININEERKRSNGSANYLNFMNGIYCKADLIFSIFFVEKISLDVIESPPFNFQL